MLLFYGIGNCSYSSGTQCSTKLLTKRWLCTFLLFLFHVNEAMERTYLSEKLMTIYRVWENDKKECNNSEVF